MLMSSGPLVADTVRRLLTVVPRAYDRRAWMDVEFPPASPHPLFTGNVAGHAAMLGGLVEWREWDAAGNAGGLTLALDGTPMHCDDDERWCDAGRAALGVGETLAHALFFPWVSRKVVIEALRDIVNAVDEDTISDRLDRTVRNVPLTGGRGYIRDPRGYRRT